MRHARQILFCVVSLGSAGWLRGSRKDTRAGETGTRGRMCAWTKRASTAARARMRKVYHAFHGGARGCCAVAFACDAARASRTCAEDSAKRLSLWPKLPSHTRVRYKHTGGQICHTSFSLCAHLWCTVDVTPQELAHAQDAIRTPQSVHRADKLQKGATCR